MARSQNREHTANWSVDLGFLLHELLTESAFRLQVAQENSRFRALMAAQLNAAAGKGLLQDETKIYEVEELSEPPKVVEGVPQT